MGPWAPKLIPRKTFQAYRRVQQLGPRNEVLSPTETPYDVLNASAQPAKGTWSEPLPEGYRDTDIQVIYTTTEVLPEIEGTDQLGDYVEIRGETYKAIKTKVWDVGVQTHYEVYVSKINER